MIQNKKLILFDLDGTLIDSAPDLAYALNSMLRTLKKEEFSEVIIDTWVGNGAKVLVWRALSGDVVVDRSLDAKELESALKIFLDFYTKNVCVKTVTYPDVQETLSILKNRGYTMAIVTNKPYAFIEPILKKLGLAEFFELTIGGDSLEKRKPEPEPLLYLCAKLKISPVDTLMIGDSKNDILSASSAGIESIAVTYGYNYGEDITTYKPNVVVNNFKDILNYLEK